LKKSRARRARVSGEGDNGALVEHLVVSYYSCCDSEAGSSIASRREAGADVAHFPPTPLRLRLQARGVALKFF